MLTVNQAGQHVTSGKSVACLTATWPRSLDNYHHNSYADCQQPGMWPHLTWVDTSQMWNVIGRVDVKELWVFFRKPQRRLTLQVFLLILYFFRCFVPISDWNAAHFGRIPSFAHQVWDATGFKLCSDPMWSRMTLKGPQATSVTLVMTFTGRRKGTSKVLQSLGLPRLQLRA